MPAPVLRAPALFRRLREVDVSSQLWAVVSADTDDGVRARLQVDVTLRTEHGGEVTPAAEESALVAIEDALRRRISTATVGTLPVGGAPADWLPVDLVPGLVIDHAYVTISEVEVDDALRRLVVDTTGS